MTIRSVCNGLLTNNRCYSLSRLCWPRSKEGQDKSWGFCGNTLFSFFAWLCRRLLVTFCYFILVLGFHKQIYRCIFRRRKDETRLDSRVSSKISNGFTKISGVSCLWQKPRGNVCCTSFHASILNGQDWGICETWTWRFCSMNIRPYR